ncbi:FAD/NAD(P)-binding protein [Flavobacterium aquicola]|uniref:Putative NAD(P)/FAD-binding protein YdhS n=1 Tax=Flavobacterium aquicola TaxID=1682742 RepID=A0A3E0E003_9FLAO|nr:FAD/NAD(P)-binding protein [Flavobacterium aquicola]REG91652.1 putative NAD(P)/FAD-binding protein YdhS [Flavobacterium aquicola]
METNELRKRIAIIGGGPSGLFLYKRLLESSDSNFEVHIFEKKDVLGSGMPYSCDGANDEHITNVSDNETPDMVSSIQEWMRTIPADLLERFGIDYENFNEYKVLPRLLFGYYLSAQFKLLQEIAEIKGITTRIHYQTNVTDIIFDEQTKVVWAETLKGKIKFDYVIISIGHNWPMRHEGKIKGYYDSPYPPSKLKLKLNHTIAIKGSSLTAIDAVRTLARNNGSFQKDADGNLNYQINPECPDFKMILHSRNGMFPAVRFHLEDSHLKNNSLLTEEEIDQHRNSNEGFLSLDFLFQNNFIKIFREKDPDFYDKIKNLSIEEFVQEMMELRERLDPFQLLKAEYIQAEKSIKRQESIYWKEMLAVLSFAMNHPAKYLSAEDMQRLQKVLMPLISIVIAFVPQKSCVELLALRQAGVLDIVAVGSDSRVEPQSGGGAVYEYSDENDNAQAVFYNTFVDCAGQPHLQYDDFPFKSLLAQKAVSPARLKFKSAAIGSKALADENLSMEKDLNDNYYLNVSGIAVNDNFQIIDQYGAYNEKIYIMAVPYIGGLNPDYSGLDFCEAASLIIIGNILMKEK